MLQAVNLRIASSNLVDTANLSGGSKKEYALGCLPSESGVRFPSPGPKLRKVVMKHNTAVYKYLCEDSDGEFFTTSEWYQNIELVRDEYEYDIIVHRRIPESVISGKKLMDKMKTDSCYIVLTEYTQKVYDNKKII